MVDYKINTDSIGGDLFDCTRIKNSGQVAGACILPLPQAIAYCNVEANCGGFDLTTNVNYLSQGL